MKAEEKTLHKRLWTLYRNYGDPSSIMFHVPNGERRGPRTARDLWSMGVVPGVPDFLCHTGPEASFYVELKRPGGTYSADQRRFRKRCAALGIDVFLFDDVLTAALFLQRKGVLRRDIQFTAAQLAFEVREKEPETAA